MVYNVELLLTDVSSEIVEQYILGLFLITKKIKRVRHLLSATCFIKYIIEEYGVPSSLQDDMICKYSFK